MDILGWLAALVWLVLDDFMSSTLHEITDRCQILLKRKSDDSNHFAVFGLHCANQMDC